MASALYSAASAALSSLTDPGSGLPLAKVARFVSTESDNKLSLVFAYPCAGNHEQVRLALAQQISQATGQTIDASAIQITTQVVAHAVQGGLKPLPGVKNVIAIASGKGGVGKSTTTVNLALALAAEGARVGVLDADIYGPSIPTMLGVEGKPETEDGKTMLPKVGHGLQTNSIGFLIDKDQAMVWRGPMVTQALDQLLRQTQWQDLDYLLVDMPPGTGDIHLSLAQRVPLTGAVIVTTPQEIALMDARKGLKMFEKVAVPILGIVENMGLHICSQCGHMEHIFGEGGGESMSQTYGVPMLGSLPLNIKIREHADAGAPSLVADPQGPIAALYKQIARRMAAGVSQIAKDMSGKFPTIVVQNT
jgi:ATP-binding protein involved in chromosome partitioning